MVKNLSVFFPAYNEEKNLEETVRKAVAVLPRSFDTWEVIIVNDGSTDRTGAIARNLAREYPQIKLVEHSVNLGYGATFRSGAYAASFDWIALNDADGQFDFAEIKNFVRKQEETGADLVIGYYLKRAVPFYRKVNTFLWEGLVKLLFGVNVKDIDCGFKLFSRKVIKNIAKLESERGAFISTEFLAKAKKAGFKIAEVGVHHYPRRRGRGTGSNPKVIFRSFVDLFKLWRKLRV